MDPILLKILHLAGVFGFFAAIGAIALCKAGKAATILHGVSLALILLIGFAMLKKPPMDQYWWMAKLALWLLLGALPAFAKRKVMPGGAILGIAIAAGAGAAYLALMKPF